MIDVVSSLALACFVLRNGSRDLQLQDESWIQKPARGANPVVQASLETAITCHASHPITGKAQTATDRDVDRKSDARYK